MTREDAAWILKLIRDRDVKQERSRTGRQRTGGRKEGWR